MSFTIDNQSLKDLHLPGKYQSNSVFSFFNKVKTAGGEKVLERLFREPLSDAQAINERVDLFRYLQQKALRFPFGAGQLETVNGFLETPAKGNLPTAVGRLLRNRIAKDLVKSPAFDEERQTLIQVIAWLVQVREFIDRCKDDTGHPFQQELALHSTLLQDTRVQHMLQTFESNDAYRQHRSPGLVQILQWGHLLQATLKEALLQLVNWVYWMDAALAVTTVAADQQLNYGYALPATAHLLRAVQLRHPLLAQATGNDLHLTQQENVIFLTGANMAGKSTWMKTVGVSCYLAHLGFPVAAAQFEFSVCDGIYSSINVPDNLAMGFSHFYAEVLRVKEVAQEVSRGKNLLVLFDELFKGTNVKDAFDANYAVTKAFAAYTNCRFIISTHIIEVGNALTGTDNIQFRYMPTVMKGTVPHYTYTLTPGITADRQGMIILENEKILDMLQG